MTRPVRFRALTRTLLAAALAAAAAVAGPAAHADPPGSPSAADVQKSKDVVAQRAKEVAAARVQVARTQAQLDRLGQTAEVAVEHWHAAVVQQEQARRKEQATRVVLDAARARVATAQHRMNAFVAAAYMSGGDLTKLQVVTDADPSTFLRKMGALDAVSRQQRTAVGELTAARAYQQAVVAAAHRLTAQADAAAKAAADARSAAQAQVDKQQALVGTLQAQESHLEALLDNARTKAQRLEHQRAVALAAERARQARLAEIAREKAAAEAALNAARNSGGQPAPVVQGGDPGAVAVRWALSELGVPYSWGGGDASGPTYGFAQGAGILGFDCSGLTLYAYAHAGVYLDHWTGSQWNAGRHVSQSELRPGDLLFFATDTADPSTIHHVGMYIGGGQMVEAPYTGGVVRISYAFRPDLIGAVRPYAG